MAGILQGYKPGRYSGEGSFIAGVTILLSITGGNSDWIPPSFQGYSWHAGGGQSCRTLKSSLYAGLESFLHERDIFTTGASAVD